MTSLKQERQPEPNNEQPKFTLTKIIFLDIDGVLLPFPSNERSSSSSSSSSSRIFPDESLQALSKLLTHTKADLVLSSTWRARPEFVNDILDCFENYGKEYGGPLATVNNNFMDMTDRNMHSERQWEIYDWVQNHQYCNTKIIWLALDDEELIEGESNKQYRHVFEGHCVKPQSSVGLTIDDVNTGIELWEKQLLLATQQKANNTS